MKSVITCDMEGRVLTMKDDDVKIYGYKKEKIIGKKSEEIEKILGYAVKAEIIHRNNLSY